ncbi:calcium-binding protein [Inquilinus sp. NPDC058860]|uniref:calcium-binding protein n=1 Tax=Inquilinus sp. NPDC058860 TaxID=3346652 RepID=UPI0036ABE03A
MPVRKWGGERVVGTTFNSNIREADVAGLADGGYVVVWQDDSVPQRVVAQRFDASGNPVGTEILVVSEGAGTAYREPQVVGLAEGGFAVAFTSATGDGNAWVNRYDADGAFMIGHGWANAAGEEQGAITSSDAIDYRHVYVSGGDIRIGFDTVNNDLTTGIQEAPSIAEIAGGTRYVVTWVDHNGGHNYRYRVFESNGTAVTGSLQVNNTAGVGAAGDHPAVVIGLANGGFVIAWYEFSTALEDRSGVSVHAQIYNSAGGEVGTEFVVNSTFKNHQAFPDLVALPDGGFVAVWSDSSSGVNSADYNIVGQVFDAFGQRVGSQFTVNTGTDGASGQFNPHVAALADGRLVVEWRSSATDEIRIQIIDPRDGVVTGDEGADALYGHNSVADEINGLGGDDVLNGLNGDDALYGGDGDDILRGGAGADDLDGGAGTASYYGSATGVVVSLVTGLGSGGEAQGDTLTGIENLAGSLGNDSLVGDSGANTLSGSNGNDILTGAGGKDTLTGGAGLDRFVTSSTAQSPVGAGADRITDFSHAQGDRIDLSAIDASTGAAGDQAFGFIGTAVYTGVAGQLRYAISGGVTTIAGDVNGDKVSDFQIQLTGSIALVSGDFVL